MVMKIAPTDADDEEELSPVPSGATKRNTAPKSRCTSLSQLSTRRHSSRHCRQRTRKRRKWCSVRSSTGTWLTFQDRRRHKIIYTRSISSIQTPAGASCASTARSGRKEVTMREMSMTRVIVTAVNCSPKHRRTKAADDPAGRGGSAETCEKQRFTKSRRTHERCQGNNQSLLLRAPVSGTTLLSSTNGFGGASEGAGKGEGASTEKAVNPNEAFEETRNEELSLIDELNNDVEKQAPQKTGSGSSTRATMIMMKKGPLKKPLVLCRVHHRPCQ